MNLLIRRDVHAGVSVYFEQQVRTQHGDSAKRGSDTKPIAQTGCYGCCFHHCVANPATEFVKVTLPPVNSTKIYYQIYNRSGQIADEADLTGVGNNLQIPVNQLANGVYTPVLRDENCRWSATFVR